MRIGILTACGLVLMIGAPAFADHEEFVKKAASGGILEVQLGKLAASQGENPDVKKFGERMVTDHTKANDELKTLAQKKGITIPNELMKDHQQTYDMFKNMRGAEFDKAYMKQMVKDHQDTVALFEKEAKEGKEEQFRAFAERTLPTLKEHLTMSRATADKVGASTK